MGEVLLQYDGLQVLPLLKQCRVLLTADKTGPGTEGITEPVTVTPEVVLDKVRVDTAAGAEDAVAHPVPTLLDLSYHEHSGVHYGPLPPTLRSGGDRTELSESDSTEQQD